MELKEFISETLTNIVLGVENAREVLNDNEVLINPVTTNGTTIAVGQNNYRHIQNVEFDLLVNIEEQNEDNKANEIKSKAKINVISMLGLDVTGSDSEFSKNATKHNKASRVKFSVPISLKPNTEHKPF